MQKQLEKSSYDYSIVFSEKLAKELLLQAEIFIDEVETLFFKKS